LLPPRDRKGMGEFVLGFLHASRLEKQSSPQSVEFDFGDVLLGFLCR